MLGVVLLAAGITTLVLAVNPDKDSANFPMVLGGTVASTAGLVLLAPAAVRVLALVGRRSPLAPRIALRDLRRHQARSGAALAAITLGSRSRSRWSWSLRRPKTARLRATSRRASC